jgi:hypothetical protein
VLRQKNGKIILKFTKITSNYKLQNGIREMALAARKRGASSKQKNRYTNQHPNAQTLE